LVVELMVAAAAPGVQGVLPTEKKRLEFKEHTGNIW
jgi:hypothetical protein